MEKGKRKRDSYGKVLKTKVIMDADIEELIEKVDSLPPSTRREGTGRYLRIVDNICKKPQGTYKIHIEKMNLPLKSIYPSIEKVIMAIAKRNKIDFTKKETKTVSTKKGDITYTSYPEFKKWKESNLQIRTRGKEIFLEKNTDKIL